MKIYNPYVFILSLALLCLNCREPFDVESIDFSNTLVLESTITNELKQQEVKLSRTYRLEDNEPAIENNATVWVDDSNNNTYTFSQASNGIYLSDIEFQAVENILYTLHVTTQKGKEYQSTDVELTPVSEITNLYTELVTLNNGDVGIQVFLDSDNSNTTAQYFRYKYEETYKIRAPNHYPFDAIITNFRQNASGIEYDIDIVPREQEEKICFTTKYSVGIIQTTTNELENNIVSRFPIRFIPIDDSIILERYSILVKQYIQSLDSYTFYNTIDELGSIGSILSQSQPGYVTGNITALQDSTEKVLGYFETATISSQRIYFSFQDFNIPRPPYFYECNVKTLDYNDNTSQDGDTNERNQLYQLLTEDNFKLVSPGIRIVNPECGDCTSISSNIIPDFWED